MLAEQTKKCCDTESFKKLLCSPNVTLEQLREEVNRHVFQFNIKKRLLCLEAMRIHPIKTKRLSPVFVRAIELAKEDKEERGENALLTLCRMDRAAMRRYMGMKKEEILANYTHNDLGKEVK